MPTTSFAILMAKALWGPKLSSNSPKTAVPSATMKIAAGEGAFDSLCPPYPITHTHSLFTSHPCLLSGGNTLLILPPAIVQKVVATEEEEEVVEKEVEEEAAESHPVFALLCRACLATPVGRCVSSRIRSWPMPYGLFPSSWSRRRRALYPSSNVHWADPYWPWPDLEPRS